MVHQWLQILANGDEYVDLFLQLSAPYKANHGTTPIEVILAILLESFTFEIPSDLPAPIVWNLAGIQYPSVGYESEKGQLPLKVTLVQTRL